jgi:hypothetical protein
VILDLTNLPNPPPPNVTWQRTFKYIVSVNQTVTLLAAPNYIVAFFNDNGNLSVTSTMYLPFSPSFRISGMGLHPHFSNTSEAQVTIGGQQMGFTQLLIISATHDRIGRLFFSRLVNIVNFIDQTVAFWTDPHSITNVINATASALNNLYWNVREDLYDLYFAQRNHSAILEMALISPLKPGEGIYMCVEERLIRTN